MTIQTGDLIFYRVDQGLIDMLIGQLEHAFREDGRVTGPGFCHVAMVAGDPRLCVEMVQPQSRVRPLVNDNRDKLFMRVKTATPDQVQAAIDWSYHNVGMHYNLLEYATSHWGIGPEPLDFCSVFLAHGAWEQGAQLNLLDPMPKMISPDELSQSPYLVIIDA